jgi:luciferase family oxidoreductase group 1
MTGQTQSRAASYPAQGLPARGAAPAVALAAPRPYIGAMTSLSILDLSPIIEGGDAGQALRNSRDLAAHAEQWGYRRFWMAEHHNMAGVASAATSVALGFVAEGTHTIRIGAGGIMLPNHAPLVIAEQFGTLSALYPGRIDLGLGRAPGTDQLTAQALRRTLAGNVDRFPNDVLELMGYFEPAVPGQAVRAVPGEGQDIEVWVLGSSTYGAQLAAVLGLPYAFASHFAPAQMEAALEIYRRQFRPSARLAKPHVMLGLNVIAAEDDREAELLFTSLQQAFINLRTGRPGRLPPPIDPGEFRRDPQVQHMVQEVLSRAVVGSPEKVRRGLEAFARRTGADEIMVTAQIYDHRARLRSFELTAQVSQALEPAAGHAG